MKKVFGIAAALLTLALFASCKTTTVKGSGLKGDDPKLAVGKTAIIDYQGRELGGEIPLWVKELANGNYSESALSKIMPDVKGKKVFVTIGYGDNLDFVRQWTDLVDVETEVTSSLERVAVKAVEAEMVGSTAESGTKTVSPAEIQKNQDMYRASLSSVRVTGLEKIAQYWILSQVVDGKNVVTEPKYSYYAVWGIEKNIYETHIDEAMKKINDTTTEGEMLKKLVREKLVEKLSISSNDTTIVEEADEAVIAEK
ncbi:MAG: hypothetical protein IJS09_01200 [Treponema sp.]|nr:hypothetical protein [Treponema sp.]